MFLRTASHELIGWADDGESQLYAEIMRRAVAPEEADRQIAATREFDVTGESRKVGCPALVIHRRDLDWVGVDLSRDLAADLADAGLVVIDGRSPLPGAGEIASAARSIGRFLDLEPDRGAPGRSPGEMRAVLFTDLVDHTRMMSSLGDTRGRDVLREHERITRQVLADHDGTEVKALGDGFMASFGGVTKAVECAIGLQRRIDEWNAVEKPSDLPDVAVRIGLNAGEPIEEGRDLFGATVILASRIAGSAIAGEILVANTVRELSAGKGFNFVDRGTFTPKGFDEPMHVWAVEWRGR